MTGIIDGKAVAKEVQKQIKEEVEGLRAALGFGAGIGGGLVGDDPASHIYVRNKEKACKEVGINPSSICCLRRFRKRNCWRWSNNSTKTKTFMVFWCSCRCRRTFARKNVFETISPL